MNDISIFVLPNDVLGVIAMFLPIPKDYFNFVMSCKRMAEVSKKIMDVKIEQMKELREEAVVVDDCDLDHLDRLHEHTDFPMYSEMNDLSDMLDGTFDSDYTLQQLMKWIDNNYYDSCWIDYMYHLETEHEATCDICYICLSKIDKGEPEDVNPESSCKRKRTMCFVKVGSRGAIAHKECCENHGFVGFFTDTEYNIIIEGIREYYEDMVSNIPDDEYEDIDNDYEVEYIDD